MKKVVWHYGKTGTGKSFEVELNFSQFCLGQRWIERFDKLSLRRQMRGFSNTTCDELVFDNVSQVDSCGNGLSFEEFLKLTNKDQKTWRGFYTSNWNTVRFTSVRTPDEVFPDLTPDKVWSRIDTFVYHYFKDSTGAWGYKAFDLDDSVPDLRSFEIEILDECPTALFTIEDLLAAGGEPENYSYGCHRLDELGISYTRNDNGSFTVGEAVPEVDFVSFVFNVWSNEILNSRYHKDAHILIIDDGRKPKKTLVFFDVSPDEYFTFISSPSSYEDFDAQVKTLSSTHEKRKLDFGARPPEWYIARELDPSLSKVNTIMFS